MTDDELIDYPTGCVDAVSYHGIASLHLGLVSRDCARAGVGPGWRRLVDRMYDVVEPARDRGTRVAVTQVKQKWGELRISVRGDDAAPLRELASRLRELSRTTCESCGALAPAGPRDVLRGLVALPRVRAYCDDCNAAARVGEPRRTFRRIESLFKRAKQQRDH